MKRINNKFLCVSKYLVIVLGVLTFIAIVVAAITMMEILFTVFKISFICFLWLAMFYAIWKYVYEEKNKNT